MVAAKRNDVDIAWTELPPDVIIAVQPNAHAPPPSMPTPPPASTLSPVIMSPTPAPAPTPAYKGHTNIAPIASRLCRLYDSPRDYARPCLEPGTNRRLLPV